jgi:hypothetical protein
MMLKKDTIKVLGLSKDEVRILGVLSNTTLRTSDIAVLAKIPRTTCERSLGKLAARGLARKRKYSAHRGGWRGIELEEVIEMLSSATAARGKEAYKVTHVVGFGEMREFEYELLHRLKNKKYSGIQGVKAWRAFHNTFSKEEAHRINELLVTSNILADVIISDKTDKELLSRAYFDRPSLVHTVPDRFLNTPFDIEITAKEVAIMNWETHRTLSIVDEDIAKLFLGIFEYMKESSEYFNVYREIEKG